MESFRKLGLNEQLLKLLEKANFSKPSEIQEKVIPLVIQGKDVIGGSATGSGKTLAFGAGIIEQIETKKPGQVLILTPTRELAEQISHVFIRFGSYKHLNVATVYGGVNINPQVYQLKHAEVIVGTPGRILDHLERGTINLTRIKTLVLDEADRMLDMGFINDVEKIIKNCPKERQTLLFSATISADIEHISSKHMRNPISISVESYVDAKKLKQIYYNVPKDLKFSLLVHLLKKETYGLVMVFCNTRHNTDFIANNLRNFSIESMAIHGGLTQQKRNSIMDKFNEKKAYVLVCTDIAARGLDIKGVSHVYNYDIPKTSKDYIHRIGRTARAGKEGIAINILSERDYENFRNVLKDESLFIERVEMPQIERVVMIIKKPFERGRERWDSNDWHAKKRYSDNSKDRDRHTHTRQHDTRENRSSDVQRGAERSHDRRSFAASHHHSNSGGSHRRNFSSRRGSNSRSGNRGSSRFAGYTKRTNFSSNRGSGRRH